MTVNTVAARSMVCVKTVPEHQWRQFIDAHNKGVLYQLPIWTTFLKDVFGMEARHLYCLEEGNLVGFLPLFTRHNRNQTSSPLRDRGGILCTFDRGGQKILRTAVQECDESNMASVEIKQAEENALCLAAGFRRIDYWVRSYIPLPDDPDVLWNAINNKARGKVRQAIKAGLELEEAPAEDWHFFYELFLQTRRKLGVPAYPPFVIKEICRRFIPAGFAKLFFVRKGTSRLASMICFAYKGQMIDAYAASAHEGLADRPNDFLKWSVIRFAIEHGFQEFDFGMDAPSQVSLLQFKKKWGAQQGQVPYYVYSPDADNFTIDVASNGRLAEMSQRIVPHLPLFAFSALNRLAFHYLISRL